MTNAEKLLLKSIITRRLWGILWKLLNLYFYATAWQGYFWDYLNIETRGFYWDWERNLFFFLLVKGARPSNEYLLKFHNSGKTI